jgi:hypothetical protein
MSGGAASRTRHGRRPCGGDSKRGATATMLVPDGNNETAAAPRAAVPFHGACRSVPRITARSFQAG